MPYELNLLEDNKTIVAKFRGILDENIANSFYADVKTFLQLEAKTYLFLLDFIDCSEFTDGAKQIIVKFSRELHDFALKFGVCANPEINLKISQMFERLSGLSQVRIFKNYEEAIAWLKQ
jgi:hypothetical protein